MDFNLDESQTAVAELAAKILSDLCTTEALRAHELAGGGVFAPAWSALAESGLVGLALPEAVGGGGLTILEASLVAEQIGRYVAPVPYTSTVPAAMALGEHELAGSAATGETVVALALDGDARVSGAHEITGSFPFTTWAPGAHAFVVAAASDAGDPGLYLVRPGGGVEVEPEDAMWGLPQATLELTAAAGERLGGSDLVVAIREAATVLNCATVAGLCEGATRITAGYVSEREQFGTRIGTFQAVGQRMADAYIDTQGVHLTARQAAWRLSVGLPAADAVDIAKYWAADAGHRVAHAAQHLHGGIGLDIDYPIHRYFRWIKCLELHLGTATDHLRSLGASLASTPA